MKRKRPFQRRLSFQTLEQRIALDASDQYDMSQLELRANYTTFDAPANHVTPRGTPNGLDGVVLLTIQGTIGQNQFTAWGTGTLLPNGTHIITAAHLINGVAPNPIPTNTNITATFELPAGNVVQGILLNQIQVHPNWNRNLFNGNDLAVIQLAAPAPAAAPRFDIFRGNTEILAVTDKVGYGLSGQGIIQPQFPVGTKRDGDNRYDFFANGTAISSEPAGGVLQTSAPPRL